MTKLLGGAQEISTVIGNLVIGSMCVSGGKKWFHLMGETSALCRAASLLRRPIQAGTEYLSPHINVPERKRDIILGWRTSWRAH